MQHDRHLAAILFSDIVGYSGMMQQDEVRAMNLVNHYLAVLKSSVCAHSGKILNDYGDGNLCTFPSAFEALKCAMELQAKLREEPAVPLRIGLHIGEIFLQNRKVFGDGVNIASRIQSLAIGNSILISSAFHNNIKNQSEFKTVSIGQFHFKNIDEPMEVFALTNDGLDVPKKSEMRGKLKQQRNSFFQKPILTPAAFILVIFLAFLVYRQFTNKTGAENTNKSIAVMAFTDMSSKHDQEYLGDGIAQEILDKLSKFQDLKVTARSSSFSFKGKNEDIRQIGNKLNAGHILTGTVRKEDNQIRVSVELINAATGILIFSEQYDYEPKNILALESDIAVAVAGKIKTTAVFKRKRFAHRQKGSQPLCL